MRLPFLRGGHRSADTGPRGIESLAQDFPDPSVLPAVGSWWAYATGSAGRNLQAMTSRDLRAWSVIVDPLPRLPGWASPGRTWSPAVIHRSGVYLMWYAVTDAATGRQAISWAEADRPDGPFVDRSAGPAIEQLDEGGSIDPETFTDSDGSTYLLWKSEGNAVGRPTRLWAARLAPDARSLVGDTVELLALSGGWQGRVIEGPAMARSDAGYILLYGANDWQSERAGIGYATGSSPLGPFVEQCRRGPWLGSEPGAVGPAGPAVFEGPGGAPVIAYHAWHGPTRYRSGGIRTLRVAALEFRDGHPLLAAWPAPAP